MNMLFRAIENWAGNEHERIFIANFFPKYFVKIKILSTFAPAIERDAVLKMLKRGF